MAKKTQLDEIIDELNTEIDEESKWLDIKKTFRDQLVAKRNEKKKEKEVKIDNDQGGNSTTEEN